MLNFKNVLVLAPHTDDGELGAGGYINKLVSSGAEITYVAFSTAADSVPDGFEKDVLKSEVVKATAKLGIEPSNLIVYDYKVRNFNYNRQLILDDLIKLKNKSNYDLVLTPSTHDVHQDHYTITRECIRAFKLSTI